MLRKSIIILLNLTFGIGICFSQVNDKFYCKTSQFYVGIEVLIYENITQDIIKVYTPEFNIIDNHLIKKDGFESIVTDTISIENPLSNNLNSNDLLIDQSVFEKIRIKHILDSSNVIFEKFVDFVGDKSIDKIEFRYSKQEQNGMIPIVLSLYEGKGDDFMKYTNCDILFWEKPLELYISKIKHLGMAILIFKTDIGNSENLRMIQMIVADRNE